MPPFSQRAIILMRYAWSKIDSMALAFGIPQYNDSITDDEVIKYFGVQYRDTIREMKITSLDSIPIGSYMEVIIENRIVYNKLKQFRNSASVYFKFTTAMDGKAVDKTMIPKMIGEILREYEDEFTSFMASNVIGSFWTMRGNSACKSCKCR